MSMNPLMSGYEVRITKGLLASSADLLKNDKMVNATVRQALGQDIEETLESGEKVNAPVLTRLVAARLGYELKNPDKIDLEKWAKLLGEQKIEQAVELKGADALFGDIVITPKKDE